MVSDGSTTGAGAQGGAEETEQDAARLLAWLATIDHSRPVVLDNVTDRTPDDLWPHTARGGRGRVVATTRRRDGTASDAGRTLVDVGAYTPAEADAYLRGRLALAGPAAGRGRPGRRRGPRPPAARPRVRG